MRRSELELRDFFENASIGIHWLSANGPIIRSNRAELQMLGYGRKALDILTGEGPRVALVVTDIALPRLDGLVLARELTSLLLGVHVFTAAELARRVRGALDAGAP